ncbi:MAG: DUF6786 family protein [Rikenellaceae bacterium]
MKTYQQDRAFLGQYLKLIELSRGTKKVLLTPDLQGRVLTSTPSGDDGYSCGWINYKLIESQKPLPHCNNWGGEDRYWLGPEGGQYAIFFNPESSKQFDFEDWQAPALIDTKAWECIDESGESAKFSTTEQLTNWSGTKLLIKLDREVKLLEDSEILASINVELPSGIDVVGFESANTLTNIGDEAWCKESGALSIWILGQFIPSEDNHIILPTKSCAEAEINDSYFGKIDESRLSKDGNTYYFKGDGDKRGKIGIPPEMTIPMVFALDKVNNMLTIVKFSFEEAATDYINSMWEYQEQPYKGDVINSYNDGPLDDGTVMGGFYEIETSSKALLLKPNESQSHVSTTIHVKGELSTLEALLQEMMNKL